MAVVLMSKCLISNTSSDHSYIAYRLHRISYIDRLLMLDTDMQNSTDSIPQLPFQQMNCCWQSTLVWWLSKHFVPFKSQVNMIFTQTHQTVNKTIIVSFLISGPALPMFSFWFLLCLCFFVIRHQFLRWQLINSLKWWVFWNKIHYLN